MFNDSLLASRMIEGAAHVAVTAHASQLRKSSARALYVSHPIAVALVLAANGVTDHVTLAAAMLHDVTEDTQWKPADVERVMIDVFGCDKRDVITMLQIIADMSEVKRDSSGAKLPWRVRKEEHLARVRSRASAATVALKIADAYHSATCVLSEIKRHGLAEAMRPFNAPLADMIWYWRETASLRNEHIEDCVSSLRNELLKTAKAIEAEVNNGSTSV